MRYGLCLRLSGQMADASRVLEMAKAAEGAGWDAFFLSDVVYEAGNVPVADACVVLAAVAAVTARMRLGLLTAVADRRRPWVLARQSVVIDHLSQGRLTLGTGVSYGGFQGGPQGARRGASEAEDELASLFDESLAVLFQCWSGKPVRHEGKWMHVDSAPFLPTPLQRPRIPVWLSAEWPRRSGLRRAANAEGVLPVFADQGEEGAPESEQVRAVCEELERLGVPAGYDVVLQGPLGKGRSDEELERLRHLEEAGATWWLATPAPEQSPLSVLDRLAAGPPRGG